MGGENPKEITEKNKTPQRKSPFQRKVKKYVIQVCAFLKMQDAQKVKEDLRKKGLSAKVIKIRVKGKIWHRVYIEEKGGETRLQRIISKLKRMGFQPLVRKQ